MPTSITLTSFSSEVIPPATTSSVPIVVTLANSEMASQLQQVEDYRFAFYTSTTYSGSGVGGLSGADALCNVRAAAAGLPGTYRAWLGDSTGSPSTRFTQRTEPYRLADTTLIANDFTDLADGTLQAALNLDEFGLGVSGTFAWTNVTTGGVTAGAESCSDWASDSGTGNRGSTNNTSIVWMSSSTLSCGSNSRLYCIGQ